MRESRAIDEQDYDFVIVGSGAGGGPLAANLALDGFDVLVIEAGGDTADDLHRVPAFHPLASEEPERSWAFFVDHYSDRPERDPKHHALSAEIPGAPGIFYPRSSQVGGCTGHHAMITVYPFESDWEHIRALTGDESWAPEPMRSYFERIERAQYQDGSVILKLLEPAQAVGDLYERFSGRLRDLTGMDEGEAARGTKGGGWLTVSQADPMLLTRDRPILRICRQLVKVGRKRGIYPMPGMNPNNPWVSEKKLQGINVLPISTHCGKRSGARERLVAAQRLLRDLEGQDVEHGSLTIAAHHFATELVFAEDDPTRAVGVRCVPGESLYGARHPKQPAGARGEPVVFRAKKEVILSGGAFNTPQLLMLSGIGPREHLEEHGIEVRVDLPGVGQRLQDRYEVSVVAKAPKDFKLLRGADFVPRAPGSSEPTDPVFEEWLDGGGIYNTNGTLLGMIMRSSVVGADDDPDLYIFSAPLDFRGYQLGYSERVREVKDHFSWLVLKGRTDNRSGHVRLRSADPFATPEIHFRYFEESDEGEERDVQAVVDGIRVIEEMYDELIDEGVLSEQLEPKKGSDYHQYVRDHAWGHHASCTCAIGADDDPLAVLDSEFRVRGTRGLRVVDASAFPRVPGLFIVCSIYMISEKASDILRDEHRPR